MHTKSSRRSAQACQLLGLEVSFRFPISAKRKFVTFDVATDRLSILERVLTLFKSDTRSRHRSRRNFVSAAKLSSPALSEETGPAALGAKSVF